MPVKIRAIAMVATVVFLSACNSGQSQTIEEPFELELAARADGSSLRISGSANVPDGALITVIVVRNIKVNEAYEETTQGVGGDGVELKDGRFATTVDLERESFQDLVAEDRFVAEVSRSVTVCAQLRANGKLESPQPDDVMDVLGSAGKNLKSSRQAMEVGDTMWLQTLVVTPAPSTEVEQADASITVSDQVGEPVCPS